MAFTYDQLFYMSQRHIKLVNNQTAIWENIATERHCSSTLACDGTLRNTTGLALALRDVNNDMLAFLEMLLFSSFRSNLKIACGGGVHF